MKTDDDVKPRPPLVLLTGFLGAGKTTTLNRVLGRQQRLRVGVIINELGRIDIDTRLIKSRAGDVMVTASWRIASTSRGSVRYTGPRGSASICSSARSTTASSWTGVRSS